MGLVGKKQKELGTPRLLLRGWKDSDLEDYLQFARDKTVMLPAGAKTVQTAEEVEKSFTKMKRNKDCYAIVLKENGKAIGEIKFQKDHRRHEVHSLSIGYELSRRHWGRGYMTEALREMVRCAFEERKVEVLSIGHFTGNIRSKRVIEKCGFRFEGTLRCAFGRFDGAVFDDECYSILREEYFAARKTSGD